MSANLNELEGKCQKTIEAFKRELGKLRSGRASAALLDGIHADYYGSSVPLIQLGNISAPEPRLIMITVYDKGAVEPIAKAIQAADLGLNPSWEGTMIRIVIPALTEERRKDLIKKLHKMAEESRVAVRGHRREMNDALKIQKDKKLVTEDQFKKDSDAVQKVTDKRVKEIDDLLAAKEKEMMDL